MQADPLQAHKLFHSTDLDEARERVAAVFCPHRLDRIGRGVTDARQHHLAGDRLSLNYIQYGAKTLIAPGELERFYLLQIPLSGGAAVVNGTDRYYSSPAAAAVLNPHLATTMIWEEGTRQVLVQIDRQALMDHLSAQLGATGRSGRPAPDLYGRAGPDARGRGGAATVGVVSGGRGGWRHIANRDGYDGTGRGIGLAVGIAGGAPPRL